MKKEMTDEEASAIVDAHDKRHAAWLARPLDRNEWIELLMRCQNGQCTCLFVLEKIEREIEMAEAGVANVDAMVGAFLRWPLPDTVCPDPCASIPGYKDRVGTNLMTAVEAKKMIQDVVLPHIKCPVGPSGGAPLPSLPPFDFGKQYAPGYSTLTGPAAPATLPVQEIDQEEKLRHA